jgi:hypothetical protein
MLILKLSHARAALVFILRHKLDLAYVAKLIRNQSCPLTEILIIGILHVVTKEKTYTVQ